jgi:hypothetical protein
VVVVVVVVVKLPSAATLGFRPGFFRGGCCATKGPPRKTGHKSELCAKKETACGTKHTVNSSKIHGYTMIVLEMAMLFVN